MVESTPIPLMDFDSKPQSNISAQKTKEEVNAQHKQSTPYIILWLGIGLIIVIIAVVVLAVFLLSDIDKLRLRVDSVAVNLSAVMEAMEHNANMRRNVAPPATPPKHSKATKNQNPQKPKTTVIPTHAPTPPPKDEEIDGDEDESREDEQEHEEDDVPEDEKPQKPESKDSKEQKEKKEKKEKKEEKEEKAKGGDPAKN